MRLTLRTLLAYLDDVLEPAQTKEIGAKIAESPMAAQLVSKIRDVMRRRRLTAPDVSGPSSGLDPNTVAEYLDNTLPPENIADVERVCLESDVHLAEVAAAHQILTLVLGEPIEISRDTRDRMYALVPSTTIPFPQSETPEKAAPTAEAAPAPVTAAPAAVATGTAAQTGSSFSEGIPDYLRPKPFWSRAMPYAIALLILGAWLALIAVDPSYNFFASSESPAPDESVEVADSGVTGPDATGGAAVTGVGPDADGSGPPVQQTPPESDAAGTTGGTQIASNTPASAGNGLDINLPPDPAPTDDPAGTPVGPAAQPPVPLNVPVGTTAGTGAVGTTVAAITPGTTAPPTVPAGTVPVQPPVANPPRNPALPVQNGGPANAAGVDVQYASKSGVLLNFDRRQGDWFVLPYRSMIHTGDMLAAPEPFDSVLSVDDGETTVTLQGGTVAGLVPAAATAVVGFELNRGRLVVRGSEGAAAAEPPAVPGNDAAAGGNAEAGTAIDLKIGREQFRIELLSADAVCGMEVVPRKPDRPQQLFGDDWYTGGLYVTRGTVRVSQGEDPGQILKAKSMWSLTPSNRSSEDAAAAAVQNLSVIPLWLDDTARRMSPLARQYATRFEREFDAEQSLTHSMAPTVRDRRPGIAEFAAKALALTASYQEMVQALAQVNTYEEARVAVINGLRIWLTRDPANDGILKEELAKVFPADNVNVVHRLLWGFNEDDARDPLRSSEMVELLDHDHIAVRELAFMHIYRLTGRKFDYHPQLPAAQRALVMDHWRNFLKEHGTLLPAEPAGS